MKKTKTKVVKKVVKDVYKAKIKIFGKFYESTGDTAKEAIASLKPAGVSKGMSILTISKGDVKKERILNTVQTYRLFNGGGMMKEIALKNISILFEGI